ncbi:MAG: hypothetical protein LAP86_30860, partial [Acidobacteriia bacterium]|nr:hypothetical protein [Terriglobia bacterium]
KTNGTQCGSPALRRNRFCYFHKRYQEERIRLNVDRRRRGTATFFLPVLEDANSIQMSLMQIVRLLLTGQIEHKTASLLLYALQTASANLRLTNFKPRVHEVVLDPRDAAESSLDENHLWEDEDFEEEEEEEVDAVEQEIRQKGEEAARKARFVARWEAKKEIEARERARKRYEEEEKLKDWVRQNPRYMLVRRDGRLCTELRPTEEAPKQEVAVQPQAPKPVSTNNAAQVRAKITDMIRKELPALTEVYNSALQKEADQQTLKKPPQKESLSGESETKATPGRS